MTIKKTRKPKKTKVCCRCGKKPKHKKDSYCKECRRDITRERRQEKKGYYIYLHKPLMGKNKGELLNIGSTQNMLERQSEHLRIMTKASKVIKEHKRSFYIEYTNIKGLKSRDELYYIEYELIRLYEKLQGVKPIGNDSDKRELDITEERKKELNKIIEKGFKYEYYNPSNHKKNKFIEIFGYNIL